MSQHRIKKSFSAFPGNLKMLRGGLSQAEFAKFLRIPNQATYHRYESGRIPKVHILQEISTILGITVDDLLTPIPHERAFEIVTLAITNAPAPQSGKAKLTYDSHKSFGEATGELINPKSIKAVTDAFRMKDLPHDELSRLFEHIVKTANRAPVELMKYYVLIRYAIGKELARRLEIKGK
jgi:transcriptional regulator with XRE-family HTH domain